MRALTAVRWTGAPLVLAALFAVSCLAAGSEASRTGYAVADLSAGGVALYLAGPFSAAWAAFRFAGHPEVIRTLRARRSGVAVVAGSWWPLLLGAPVAVALAVVITTRATPTDASGWALLGLYLLTVLACTLTGVLAAWALPVVVAVPLVATAWFVWLTFPASSDRPLLHNVGSTFPLCCDSSTRPSWTALAASSVLSSLLCLAVLALLVPSSWSRRSRPVLIVLLPVVIGVAAGAAVLVARSGAPLTLQATQARTTSLECRTIEGLEVCLWPENADRAPELAALARGLDAALEGWRLDPVGGITQRGRDPGSISVEAGDHLDEHDLVYSAAAGYVDRATRCVGASGPVRDVLTGFVMLAADAPETSLPERMRPEVVEAAASAYAKAQRVPGRVRAWFDEGVARVHCPGAQ